MTHDEIIAMAREAGMQANCGHTDRDGVHHPAVAALKTSVPVDWLARFADRVAAKEREVCALVCEAKAHEVRLWCNKSNVIACAAAIRARGTKEGV